MFKFFRWLVAFCMLAATAFWSPSVIAQEESPKSFENTLTTTYTVQTNGNTLVQHRFRIKNLTPSYYVSRYGLRISTPNITSPKVSDSSGEIPAEVTHSDNQTNIGITFPTEVVGEGKVREFTINYLNPDLAQIQGQVLEVAIPKQADPGQYAANSVILNTPLSYGHPTRVTPEVSFSAVNNAGQVQLTFNDLQGQGVSALYGLQQIYDLNFRYYLDNPDSQPVLLQVALPPDTPYQRMNYAKIEPQPQNIEVDEDGNWIATFYLGSNASQVVEVEASALLTLEPSGWYPHNGPQSYTTTAQPYWETNDAAIKELAAQYTTPQAIYDFVVSHLQYSTPNSLADIRRLGATGALKTPDAAACQEFSDLFVALARANGIPARVVTGYAYTQNSTLRPLSLDNDILHAWPEYWDAEQNRWVAVDPTWENTTGGVNYFDQFDLNHIVLAINGKSSTLPYPAGSYKKAGQTEKTLDVRFGSQFLPQHPAVNASLTPRRTALGNVPGFYELKVENRTGAAWYNVTLDVSAPQSGVRIFGETTLTALLPYQTITLPIFVYNTQGVWPQDDQLTVTVTVGQENPTTINETITNAPAFAQYLAHPYALIGLGAACVFLALGTGSLLILRRKR